jgi:hypothetical protein
MSNQYLEKIAKSKLGERRQGLDKEANLILGGIIGHVAQNYAAKGALRTRYASQVVADAVRKGFLHGEHYELPAKARLAAGIMGAEASEVPHIANQVGIGFKNYLDSKKHVMTKNDHLAIRMMTQGRFGDLQRLHHRTGGGTEAIAGHLHDYLSNHGHSGLPDKATLGGILGAIPKDLAGDAAKPLSQLFQKPGLKGTLRGHDYPLLNNISYNITRGKETSAPTGRIAKAVHSAIEPGAIAALGAAEPSAGLLNGFKYLLARPETQKFAPAKKLFDSLNESFAGAAKSSTKAGAQEAMHPDVARAIERAQAAKTLKQTGRLPEPKVEPEPTSLLGRIKQKLVGTAESPRFSRLLNRAKGTFVNGLAGEADRTGYAIGKSLGEGANIAAKKQ